MEFSLNSQLSNLLPTQFNLISVSFSWPRNIPTMATATTTSTSASLLLHTSPLSRRTTSVRLSAISTPHRRRSLLLFIALPAPFLAITSPSRAADIGLFGIRKRLEKIEEEAAEVVKESEKLAEEVVKEGEEAVVKEIKTAEKEIESAAAAVAAEAGAGAGFQIAGDLVQAGAVAGAEAVGVLVGLSVVNGILGPEGQN
ncbi:hypothetical protein LUZ62_060507 [Rhynchospora pubera]|uniref:Uncharacterized protein n=2 Tax=Rhynchospora pubera TaxID=906938 RepID=A0AAV8E9K7_9POAL|nr:hypothetical protein LUZ62_060507 [Rhynchospora pubera]